MQCQQYLESPYDEMIAAHIRYIQRVDEYIVRYRKNYKVSDISGVQGLLLGET